MYTKVRDGCSARVRSFIVLNEPNESRVAHAVVVYHRQYYIPTYYYILYIIVFAVRCKYSNVIGECER